MSALKTPMHEVADAEAVVDGAPGDYHLKLFDGEGDLYVRLPKPAGFCHITVSTSGKKGWRITSEDGKLSVSPSIRVSLPAIRWEGRDVPERELWHGHILNSELVPAEGA